MLPSQAPRPGPLGHGCTIGTVMVVDRKLPRLGPSRWCCSPTTYCRMLRQLKIHSNSVSLLIAIRVRVQGIAVATWTWFGRSAFPFRTSYRHAVSSAWNVNRDSKKNFYFRSNPSVYCELLLSHRPRGLLGKNHPLPCCPVGREGRRQRQEQGEISHHGRFACSIVTLHTCCVNFSPLFLQHRP